MTPRNSAIKNSKPVKKKCCCPKAGSVAEEFGSYVFNRSVMQRMLPPAVYKNLHAASKGEEVLKPEFADTIAVAMKEWAVSFGATHFTHWFHPLTGASAEKHDSFIEWETLSDSILEEFTGAQLLQGEPDASSFPSGGLRSTYEARGYTGWDPSSPAFIWKGGDGVTLCIPSVFFSWTGDILDSKIPLIRSEKKLSEVVMRLLKLTGLKTKYTFTTSGFEQEYFVIDRQLRNLRPDLIMSGRTLFGADSPKGQELQDHYFGSVKDRVLSFMHDFEHRALKLGIPLKTRHNEVAPSQHEVAPVFEKTTVAVDHNILLMELMRQTAEEHGLSCLLHEKPFAGLNGSGKHSNWSVATSGGRNLLDPTDTPENNQHFLVLLTAILAAVHKHSALLRASIGSATNDHRLGGHEAPPAIMSVFLGDQLESLLTDIEQFGTHKSKQQKEKYTLELTTIPALSKHQTDRNRTSPFAFTGNKFEFRAVGSLQSPAFPMTVLNAIVAESLEEIVSEIEKSLQGKKSRSKAEFAEVMVPVLQKYIKQSKDIRFSGDNYSSEWEKEAEKRSLPNLKKAPSSFNSIVSKETEHAFSKILTSDELASRFDILMDDYIQKIKIEVRIMLDLYRTQILPAATKTLKNFSESVLLFKEVTGGELGLLAVEKHVKAIALAIENSMKLSNELDGLCRKADAQECLSLQGEKYSTEVLKKMEEFRAEVDRMETLSEDSLWPLPKYRELLFSV